MVEEIEKFGCVIGVVDFFLESFVEWVWVLEWYCVVYLLGVIGINFFVLF